MPSRGHILGPTAIFIAAQLFACNNPGYAETFTEFGVKSRWSAGIAWGQGSSRWELDEGLRKLRPNTFRITVSYHDWVRRNVADNWVAVLDVDNSVYHWNDTFRQRDITVVTLVPMLRIHTHWKHMQPFVGFGIGLAVLDSDNWMDREMGSHLMFEDKLEVGFRYQSHQFTLGLSHFSNADLADINHGANIYQLGYQYRW